ncbi:6-carboxytetrahydropterin synthase QueD [Chloroflexota bacterium]
MYRVSIRKHFDAAHALRGYRGKCENLHGHRYEVVVQVETDKLDDIGLALDFTELKGKLGEVLERFDHACLNEVPPFDEINPSTENIATTIYEELSGKLEKVPITSIGVWESPDTWVTYLP